jgi:glycosyltransferase involved in cell wall biosynthesis
MNISVVIPARNSAWTIQSTIEAILAGSRQPDELIVVDGESDDETATITSRLGARVVPNPKRHVAAARQLGVETSSSPVVAFTDSDCLPDRDWLRLIGERFEADGKLVGVGGRVILPQPTTRVQAYSATVFENIMSFPTEPVFVTSRGMRGSFPGANCAFSRNAVLSVGGFLDFFSNHAEEVDLLWRLVAHQSRLLFDPAIVVTHLGYPDTYRKMVRANFHYGIASTKLAKRHIGRQIDGQLYRILQHNLVCAVNPMCQDQWAGLRALQISAFIVGKLYASVRYRTINI